VITGTEAEVDKAELTCRGLKAVFFQGAAVRLPGSGVAATGVTGPWYPAGTETDTPGGVAIVIERPGFPAEDPPEAGATEAERP